MSPTHLYQASGWITQQLVNGVPGGIVVALLTWFGLWMLARKNSSTRFAAWCLALVAIGALPLASGLAASYFEAHHSSSSAVVISSSWARCLFFAWLAVAGVGLIRIALGLWNLRRLRADHSPIDTSSLHPMLQRTLREFEHGRRVSLGVSQRLSVPAAIGFFKPMILVPAWAMKELSPEELNSILIHELAHLRRWDDWTNLGQKIIRALLFFHPVVWWIDHQLSLEREMACDDHVLSRMENHRTYAECLVAVAEKSLLRRGLGLVQAAVRGMRQTSRRVAKILAPNNPPRTPRVWKPVLGMVTAFSALGVVWLAQAPELVSVSDPVSTVAEASVPSPSVLAVRQTVQAPEHLVLAKLVENKGLTPPAQASAVRHPSRKPTEEGRERSLAAHQFAAQPPLANLAATELPTDTTAVLVVMTSSDARSGAWMLCVWRISVAGSHAVEGRVPAHSI
ncbi:MAG TPA: M56 family metallopeptidase [Terriglobales bacterium]|nr:M56 family metallopeptidase [Terriglobales bacterium]